MVSLYQHWVPVSRAPEDCPACKAGLPRILVKHVLARWVWVRDRLSWVDGKPTWVTIHVMGR